MLDKNKWEQFGIPREQSVKGITIHNTHNELSAKENEEVMANATDHLGTHFFVDENEIIQVMPLDWCVWHTGKGFDMGNLRTIAVEICRSTLDEETYLKAQKRAIALVKKLQKQFGLSNAEVFFHNDFAQIYCPHRILDIYKNKKNFIRKEFK